MSDIYTLDELFDVLESKLGKHPSITRKGRADGTADCEASLGGVVKATWKSRLSTPVVPIDGITPRGPSEYFDLRFF